VIALTPDNTRGYNNLGVTYFRMDRGEDAARMWERSLAIRPNYSAASNLGSYYFSHGQYSDGGARVRARGGAGADRHARVAEPRRGAVLGAWGAAEGAAGVRKRSWKLAEAERRVNPRQPALLAQLADAYAMLGSKSEALAAADRSRAARRSRRRNGFRSSAGVYEELGNRETAFTWLRQALAKGYALDTIERSPSMAELRKDARYKTLVDRAITR
jgi:tetratricopeptide (TPR) repeat protein